MTAQIPCRTLQPEEKVGGRFRVDQFLSSGRLGEVYEAEDEQRGRLVALRVLPSDLLQDESWSRRLQREIRLAERIIHPNVCRTFGLFEHRLGDLLIPVVALDLLSGESLRAKLRREGRLPAEEAIALCRQIAEALEAGHRTGLVHRNLQPGNVILLPDRAVVTDFGLVVAAGAPLAGLSEGGADQGAAAQRSAAQRSGSHSSSGIFGGSPSYMAPEQMDGDKITPATDVYALGVLLYEMTTGQLPFAGETPLAAAYRRLRERPPSPRTIVADLNPVLEKITLSCLEPDPSARLSRPRDVLMMLDGDKPASSRAEKRRRTSIAISALGLFLAAVLFLQFRDSAPANDAASTALMSHSAEALPAREDARRFYFQGLRAREEHRLLDARDLLDQAARLEPEAPLVRLALAEIYQDLGESDQAREHAEEALAKISQAGPGATLLAARAFAASEQWDEATIRLQELVRNSSKDVDLGLLYARVLADAGRELEAAGVLQEVESHGLGDVRISLAQARVEERLGNFRRCRDYAQRAAREAGSDAPHARAAARRLEAVAQLHLERTDHALAAAVEARALFEKQRDRDGLTRSLAVLAATRVARGELDVADEVLEEALQAARLLGHREREMELLAEHSKLRVVQKRYDEAVVLEEKALEIARSVGDLRRVAIHLGRLADVARSRGDDEEARSLLQESLTVARILDDRRLVDALHADLRALARRPSP